MLKFFTVAEVFDKLEGISGRLEMTDVLAELFKKTKSEEVDKLVYMMQGVLAPPYEGIDLGVGEKFAIEAIASSSGYTKQQVEKHYKKSGDLGQTAEDLLSKRKQQSLATREMDIIYVYTALVKVAKSAGPGSQELKIKLLTELLNNSSPLESRFIIRFALARLRLGVGDPTILDALSVTTVGDKSMREKLDRAYNICSDLGHVAKTYLQNPKHISRFKVQPFKPLMPALAERLSTPSEIIDKIGKCAIERKYDGLRLQCHKKGNKVEIYSRKLEKMTHMFPDVVKEIQELKTKEIIFEGEALAYDKKHKKYFSFQKTMRRRRKHDIAKTKDELPLNIFCFDLLYADRRDFTQKTYSERHKNLEKLFPQGLLKLSDRFIVDKPDKLKKIFNQSLDKGLEGIMAKDLTAPYTAGKRKFAWIKLKKSYGKSVDTVDGVIVGYFLGKGHRADFKFGGLLLAVQNEDTGKLETVAKIGSGFTEDEMLEFRSMLHKIKTKDAASDLVYNIEPDFWVEPKYVIEVAFDEITKSPTHTCARKDSTGYALRFPRLLKIRTDKGVREATTSQEVEEMYEQEHSR